MNTAKSLKIALINKDVSQTWLAEKISVHRQQVSQWCKGLGISTSNMEKICEVLDYKVSEFIALGED